MSESNALFTQLAIILSLSAALGFFVKKLRLPLLVAYLVVGLLLSLMKVFDLSHSEVLTAFPEIGIAFVLFFIGMELDLKEIKHLGKPIIAASLGQIIISTFAGFLIASALGFPEVESVLLGAGLAFSSTIVVVKMLLEKKDINSLYGKLSIGVLLIEDLVAIMVLMFMTIGTSFLGVGLNQSLPLLMLLLKGIGLIFLTLVLSRYVLERLFEAVAESTELLILTALSWCFIFVTASILLGFSVVIGAFLAGVALANSPFHLEIQGKVKPLRDFFVTLFFVYLGSQVVFESLWSVIPLIVAFTLYALVLKPLIFLLILGLFGFRKHTLYQTAITLSQVSEFSLIVMVIGLKTGLVSQSALTAMALTGVLSIIASSILISFSGKLYKHLGPFVANFEHSTLIHKIENKISNLVLDDHVILIGAHRIGGEVVNFLRKESIPFLVLDFNPKVIQTLMEKDIKALYGDVGDPEVLEFLNLEKAKLVISTATNLEDNLILLNEAKRRKVRAVLIIRAASVADAEVLYKEGANYVILPEIVSGDFISNMLKNHWPSLSYFKDRSDTELNRLSKNNLALE